MATLNTRIVLRNDSTANWLLNENQVLLKGEVGIEFLASGQPQMRIGDGTTAWKDLQPLGGASKIEVYEVTVNEGETHQDAINRIVASAPLEKGSIAIVKELIASGADKYEYTAYIYNGTDWAAMDGNYSAENTFFSADLTYTEAIGVLEKPSGSATLPAAGKSVKDVLASILAKEVNPTITQPAVSCTCSTLGSYEVGTTLSPQYSASLSAGNYQYGPATGITASSWTVSLGEQTLTTASGTFSEITIGTTPQSITATANYDGSTAVPVTNLGNPYPAGQITAGSKSATAYKSNSERGTTTFSGYRNMFYGPVTTDAEINSATIRALPYKSPTGAKTLPTFGAISGAVKVIVAVPVGRTITKVLMPSAMNADATANFIKQESSTDVEGANGFTAAAYDVYVYQPASIDATETYSIQIG